MPTLPQVSRLSLKNILFPTDLSLASRSALPFAETLALKEARERNIDLIVMSVHKSHAAAWSSHLPWPVASEVGSRAPCPVLTIRV